MLVIRCRNQKYIRRHIIEVLEQSRYDALQFPISCPSSLLGDGEFVQKKDNVLLPTLENIFLKFTLVCPR